MVGEGSISKGWALALNKVQTHRGEVSFVAFQFDRKKLIFYDGNWWVVFNILWVRCLKQPNTRDHKKGEESYKI